MNRVLTFAIAGLLSLFLVNGVMAGEDQKPLPISKKVAVINPDAIHHMNGAITSIDPTRQLLMVKNRRGEQGFYFTPETQVKKGRTLLTLGDLKPGLKVEVAYREANGKKETDMVRLRK